MPVPLSQIMWAATSEPDRSQHTTNTRNQLRNQTMRRAMELDWIQLNRIEWHGRKPNQIKPRELLEFGRRRQTLVMLRNGDLFEIPRDTLTFAVSHLPISSQFSAVQRASIRLVLHTLRESRRVSTSLDYSFAFAQSHLPARHSRWRLATTLAETGNYCCEAEESTWPACYINRTSKLIVLKLALSS